MIDQPLPTFAAGWRRAMRILSYLRPYIGIFFAGLGCAVLFGLTEAAVPWLMRLILDADQVSGWVTPEQLVYALPLAVLAIFIVRSLFGFGRTYFRHWIEHTMVADMRRELVERVTRLPQSYHDRESSGVLISRLLLYANRMTRLATEALVSLTTDIFRAIGLIATMLVIDWMLALTVLLALPVAAWTISFVGKKIRRHTASLARVEGEFTEQLADTIQGQRVVKAFGGAEREQSLLEDVISRLRGFGVRQGAALALNRPLSQLALAAAMAVVLGLLALALSRSEISEGEVGTFLFAMALMPIPIRGMAAIVENYQQALVAGGRVFAVLDSPPEPDDGTFEPEAIKGAIAFDGVRFAYPGSDREALGGISLAIEPGEKVALVGATGSGKTTLAHLLLRLYASDAGSILLDGREISEYRLASLRNAIGLVTQEVLLFDATVAENVAYPQRGDDIDQQRLDDALRRAAADSLVARMPDGVDTLLGERGMRLSGGERQRLSIARAFYKDAPILVLDEATSALDSLTEGQIRASLEDLLRGRTALVIAHRFATVEIADRIVLLDNGQVAAQGTHSEMMGASGTYRRMYEAQRLKDEADS